MKPLFKRGRAAALLLACASPLALSAMTGSALAQGPAFAPGCGGCPPTLMPNYPPPSVVQPNTTNPNTTNPNTTNPNTTTPDNTTQPAPDTTGQNPDVSLNNEGSGARGGETVALSPGGYIDDAIPQTLFRLRYEARFGFNEFDRAQYMYGTWRELGFHNHALVNNAVPKGVFVDPSARGPQIFARNLDDQDISSYLEVALGKRFSTFADVPFRFVHFRGAVEDGPQDQTPAEQAMFRERGLEVPAPSKTRQAFPTSTPASNTPLSPTPTVAT